MLKRHLIGPLACVLALSIFGSLAGAVEMQGPGPNPLATLRKAHPRLLVTQADLDRVKALLAAKNPDAERLHEELRKSARRILKQPPVEYKLIGPRLLDKSRTALRRITTLAGLYRLDGDKAFADRAIAEMLAVCAFKDWHPPHFLDTAEMTTAVSLGYDWLYDVLTPEQRKTIRDAIRDKGLGAGMTAYTARKPAFWTVTHMNWAEVCGGGMTIGALAIGDEEPKISNEILSRTYKTIRGGMSEFSPDGGCPEGPGYWNYATEYACFCMAGLDSALGNDWGLGKTPGFAQVGLFPIETTGPMQRPFNYADAGEGKLGSSPQMFWLARQYHQPLYASFERQIAPSSSDPFALLWLDPDGKFPPADFGKDAMFGHVAVACFRGSWTDPKTTFIGFKGGSNRFNHSHLDLGTFVIDALSQRWAIDLGSDNYNLPAYFGKDRWTYYRLRTEGHNTLVIDDENQSPKASAPLIAYSSTPNRALAVADLDEAYAPRTTHWKRGVELLDRSRMVVEDEVEAPQPVQIVWNFHTRAKISIDKQTATLADGDATLKATILWPADASFKVISANPPPPQRQQPDVHNLTVQLPGKVSSARIVVLLTPTESGVAPLAPPTVQPLADWIKTGPITAPVDPALRGK